MKISSSVLLITALAMGCAKATVTPPASPAPQNVKIVDKSYDETWRSAVAWFASSNIIIDKIEKDSGLITAKYTLAASDSVLDCGDIKMTGVLGEPTIERRGSLNVVLTPVSRLETQARANFFGEFTATGLDAWDARPVHLSGDCVSTGTVEQSFLNALR